MASIPTQEEFLAATRKSQEAMIAAIKNWLETVRTAAPKVTSVYAPLTERLPKLPLVGLPFADKLPTPEEAVGNAYHMAEQLLANQRKFAEDLVRVTAPLRPVRGQAAPKGNGSSEPKPVAVSEPKPAGTTSVEPKAPARPAAKSTPARRAPRTTAAKSNPAKSSPAKSSAAKSSAAKSAAGTPTPKRTPASRAPKGTDAG